MRLPSPLATRLALAVVLGLSAGPALAQRTFQGDLQQAMSPEQFKAAGLDKLSPAELAALNDWLHGKVAEETRKATAEASVALAQAREEGRQEVVAKNRGFLDFGSSEPIESNVVGAFSGFGKGRHYVLANGQEWEQTDGSQLSVRKQDPKVKIKPGIMGVWYMQVEGYNTQPKVRRVK